MLATVFWVCSQTLGQVTLSGFLPGGRMICFQKALHHGSQLVLAVGPGASGLFHMASQFEGLWVCLFCIATTKCQMLNSIEGKGICLAHDCEGWRIQTASAWHQYLTRACCFLYSMGWWRRWKGVMRKNHLAKEEAESELSWERQSQCAFLGNQPSSLRPNPHSLTGINISEGVFHDLIISLKIYKLSAIFWS